MTDSPPPTVDVLVVTALPDAPSQAAFSVVRVTPETLQTRPRVDEALRVVPGVSLFRRTGSSAANPTIQGLSLRAIAPSGAGRVLVALDGAPLNDAFGGWVIWSQLQAETLASAQVVRGAGAGPYGAGALTGVVRLASDPDPDDQLSVAVGGEGYGRAAGLVSQDLFGGRLILAGAGERSDGYVPVRAGRGAADAAVDLESFSASAAFSRSVGEAALSARAAAWREKRGAGLVGADSVADGASLSLTAARQPAQDVLGWRLQAWMQDSDLANRSVAVASGRASTTAANDQYATPARGYGFNAALRGEVWEVGVDARLFDGEVREQFRNLGQGFTRERFAGGRADVAGVYAEAWRETGPLLLTGGVRLDRWRSYDGRRVEADSVTGETVLNHSPPDRDGTVPTARLGVRYAVSDKIFWRAAAYSAFRPATLNELHRPFRVGNDITEAGPELEPERLYGLELGVGGDTRGTLGGLSWSAALFANRLDQAVANVTIGVGPGTFPLAGFVPAGGVLRQRRNVGRIEAAGLEAEIAGDLTPRLGFRAAVSAADAQVDGGDAAPQLTGKRPAQAPAWSATAGLEWAAVRRGLARLQLRYESGRWEDDLNSRRLSPALVVDARFDKAISRRAQVFFAVDNLFDAAMETGETADGVESFSTPRVWRAGLTLRP